MYDTSSDLSLTTRKSIIELLNEHLADAIDLQLQAKQAHWNVKGPNFVGLHGMFDQVASQAQGYADDIHEEGFAPLRELMANFVKADGKIYVCSPCFKRRKLDETKLVAGATIVGGAKLVEFLSEGSPCVSY